MTSWSFRNFNKFHQVLNFVSERRCMNSTQFNYVQVTISYRAKENCLWRKLLVILKCLFSVVMYMRCSYVERCNNIIEYLYFDISIEQYHADMIDLKISDQQYSTNE